MEELKNNKMFWILVVVTVFNIGAFLLGRVIIDKAADRAIQKLQKDYSPSPYGPGVDPDKVNVDGLKGARQYYEMRKTGASRVFKEENLREGDNPLIKTVAESDKWREEWEKSRGANP